MSTHNKPSRADTGADLRLLIIGASARAAAFSALRAGFKPWTADLFADRDLSRICPDAGRITRFPGEFLQVSWHGPEGPWLYTGALENARPLIRALSRQRPLWGNSAEVLKRVRCPFTVARVLQENGISCPAVLDNRAAPAAGRWLCKPLAGASGRNIRFHGNVAPVDGCYLQEYIDGEPCSAVYVAANGEAHLFGVTGQFVGEKWLHAGSFQYCGTTGALAMSVNVGDALIRLGQALAASFGLCGLFGVDFMLRDDVPWPVEINPRYAASVEVLEYATGRLALAEHARAFFGQAPCTVGPICEDMLGKAIYYAAEPLIFPPAGPWDDSLQGDFDPWRMPDFADIPRAGERFERGHPVLTFFACGRTTQQVRDHL